jgi:hypothetical protein
MAQQMFTTNLQGRLNTTPFYLYGGLSGSMTETVGSYTSGTNEAIDGNEIVTMVTKSIQGTSTDVTITSIGNIQGVKKTVIYTFTYTSGGAGEPLPPDTGSGGGGVSAGPGGMDWHTTEGIIINNPKNWDSDKPVVFTAFESLYIYNKDNGTRPYTAPQMYFTNKPTSLVITKNSTLELNTDFLSFPGMVTGGELILRVDKSTIPGEDIPGGVPGSTYGILYIGPGSGLAIQGTILLPTAQKKTGYYFFPSGINLLSSDGVNKLIKISDFNAIDPAVLAKLGSTITTTSGGLSDGEYN